MDVDESVLSWESKLPERFDGKVQSHQHQYFETYDKIIKRIADHFQESEFLFHKIIKDVFVKLCTPNSND